MVQNIVFIFMVILAIGAGVWVWHMEVSGTPILPPSKKSAQPPSDEAETLSAAENDAS